MILMDIMLDDLMKKVYVYIQEQNMMRMVLIKMVLIQMENIIKAIYHIIK